MFIQCFVCFHLFSLFRPYKIFEHHRLGMRVQNRCLRANRCLMAAHVKIDAAFPTTSIRSHFSIFPNVFSTAYVFARLAVKFQLWSKNEKPSRIPSANRILKFKSRATKKRRLRSYVDRLRSFGRFSYENFQRFALSSILMTQRVGSKICGVYIVVDAAADVLRVSAILVSVAGEYSNT